MARKNFIVVQLNEADKVTGYATNVSGASAQLVEDLESADLIKDLAAARRLAGAMQQFDPDANYQVKEVSVTVSLT